jgi:hypothetical protein
VDPLYRCIHAHGFLPKISKQQQQQEEYIKHCTLVDPLLLAYAVQLSIPIDEAISRTFAAVWQFGVFFL